MKYYYAIDKDARGQNNFIASRSSHNIIVLDVPGSGYYPEEDSEMFADFIVKNRAMFLRKKVLEIGCGSGLLSILCARFGADVLAIDINPEAVNATKENAIANNVKLSAIQSDIFAKVGAGANSCFSSRNSHNNQVSPKVGYDIIIFNSPYLPDEDMLTKKSHSINYNKGDVIKRFLAQYKNYLGKNGRAYILVSSITDEKIGGKIVMKKRIDWEELRIIELG